jgi:beta-lactam-binding protein with PASTA domain
MAIEKYRDFILVADDVEKDEEGVVQFSVEVFTSPRGGGVRVEKQQITPDLRKELGRLERRKLDADGIISLGEKLAALLLPGQVGEFFKGSLDMLKPGQGLRLRLRLDAALAGFPWEYMYLPRTGGERDSTGFVVLDPRVSIARHDAMPIPGDFDDTPKKRRLLVALASPEDQAPLDLDRERDNLKEALRDVPGIDLNFVENATIQTLADELLPGADVFHFAGHGTFGQAGAEAGYGADDGEGAILLVAEDGSAAPMPAEELAVNLRGRGVQLVVLGACETGRRGEGNVWSGVAAALMKAGIPAAVAMQYSIWDDAAIAFNRSLYRALAVGFPLDYAVSAGRLAAFNRCHPVRDDVELGKCYRDWGVPVLYLRSEQDFVLPAIPDPTRREDVARKVDDEVGPPPPHRPPKWRRWFFSALGAAAGAAVVLTILALAGVFPPKKDVRPGETAAMPETTGPTPTELLMPGVVGLMEDDAYRKLDESGLERNQIREARVESDKRSGIVVEQYPVEGVPLNEVRVVKIVVSSGPRREDLVKVPSVAGQPEKAALKKLTGRPYQFNATAEREESHDTPRGCVIRTDPDAGTKVERRSDITLTVSTGPPPVKVPPVEGKPLKSALELLKEFNVIKEYERSRDVPKDVVMSQSPSGEAPAGATITLTVSKGNLCPKCGWENRTGAKFCGHCPTPTPLPP